MTVHINKQFAVMDQNHGDDKEWRDDVCNYVMRIDILGNKFFFMGNQVLSCHLGLALDGE